MTRYIIYPNQLFEKKYIPKDADELIIWEHPDFFTKYKFNKIKLVLHRQSMKEYAQYISKYYKVTYIDYYKKAPTGEVCFFQPNKPRQNLNTPNFLCLHIFDEYRAKTDKFVFNNFYMYMKGKLDILSGIKSRDKYNRNKIVGDLQLPNDPQYKFSSVHIKYIESNFKDNPGPKLINGLFPTNRRQARALLLNFMRYRLKNFGKYQDALLFGKNSTNLLYHSGLSSSLNIGLLNPKEVIDEVLCMKGVSINSIEGFIRQIFWREYQLYCFMFMKLTEPIYPIKYNLSKKWIEGDTGLYIIDETIKKAFNTGYLHHIERLMIMGNYMLLSGLAPKSAHKWFMEFSADSYEWVMFQNVYDMIYAMGGGMRRIYISSSNYLLKMSDLKKGPWEETWNDLYKNFIKKNKGKIGYPYES